MHTGDTLVCLRLETEASLVSSTRSCDPITFLLDFCEIELDVLGGIDI